VTGDERLREEQKTAAKLFRCFQCGFEYDEAKGWPEDGIAAGTRWEDIPDDWSCPDCGAAKSDFEMIEVARS
jgi:rubredoxin